MDANNSAAKPPCNWAKNEISKIKVHNRRAGDCRRVAIIWEGGNC